MASTARKALLSVLLLAVPTACSNDDDASAHGTGGKNLTLKQPIDRGSGKLALEFGSTYFE